jgi:hypothetical protein
LLFLDLPITRFGRCRTRVDADSVDSAVRPRIGGDVFRYRLHSPDGDDFGEATYAQMIHADEEIIAGNNQHSG